MFWSHVLWIELLANFVGKKSTIEKSRTCCLANDVKWIVSGKVIFLAPTKPLVAQQISACSNIMGLKKDDIVELTGKFHYSSNSVKTGFLNVLY